MGEWISVKDRLPEEVGCYLISYYDELGERVYYGGRFIKDNPEYEDGWYDPLRWTFEYGYSDPITVDYWLDIGCAMEVKD